MVFELNLGDAALVVAALSQFQETAKKEKDNDVARRIEILIEQLRNSFSTFSSTTAQPIEDLLMEEGVNE